ncbi:peroxidase family protein [Brevundimonas lenta]|uniref:Ca2+-binding RTX toxin-like protein n=1 Tax=Brevundimonas lenta TaxID=424796 RepID=A0A7W6JGF4_9CAUL|nr:peroxidase family protein [Brevundimonas lenta]MBB4083622.1 Ca2+-binding RTX toxin-like protein [Brevundimonas lenta]
MPISLRAHDLALLDQEFAAGGFRNSSGLGNNVAHPTWGNSNQPFVRLSPAHPEPATVNGVRVTGASGSPLPNERLVSNVISQHVDANGLSIDAPSTAGTNLLLMSFGQFFDHGLDFYARGGGSQFVDLSTINAQLAQIAAANPGLNIDVTDNIIAQGVPPQLQFLIGGRAARYTVDGNGVITLDNVNGTERLNMTSPFVDQNQTYGSTQGMTFLLRETARDANGDVIRDSGGQLVKTHRLLDGAAEIGPDGVSRGGLPTYTDVLINNGLSAADLDDVLAMAAVAGNDFAAWTYLTGLAGFIDFGDIGDGTGAALIGDKNDFDASPFGQGGGPNANFSLEALLSYYVAGDHRPNENVALTAVHTVWHREHNFQAERIAELHPEWTAEEVFQAAKTITVAQYQRVVFDEFAEKMSGTLPGEGDHGFVDYNPNVNPAISDEFAGAMYRVGHSMINETIPFVDANGVLQEVSLIEAFLNPAMFAGADPDHPQISGAASLLGGLTQVGHQQIDTKVVEAVRSALLGLPLDLGAANLMRGRELGLPSLNEFRAYVSSLGTSLEQNGQASDYIDQAGIPGLTPYANWDQFGAALRGTAAERADLLARFKAVYGEDVIDPGNGLINGTGVSHVNDVDMWIGGLAEAAFGASQMGSTFTWIFQEQLDRLQDGDRFYYINQFDGSLLLRDIDSEHFSDVIARNTGLTHQHWDTFEVWERRDVAAGVLNRNFSDLNPLNVDLVLVGNALNNVLTGTNSNDTMYGGDGNDTINGGGGKDALHGEGGNDILNASLNAQDAFLYGEAGDDVLNGDDNDDILNGGDGNDILNGNDGKDYMLGGAGDDWMMGGDGVDDAYDGGDGIDTVDYSASGSGVSLNLSIPLDRLLPDEGEGGDAEGDVVVNVENLRGSAFADTLVGDGAANVIEGAAGADALNGGAGSDTASYRTSNAAVNVHLLLGTASGGHAQGDTLVSFENLIGSAFNDILTANNVANSIDGGAGADAMTGGGGGDRYYVDNLGDTVVETTGGGLDVVYASASWTLAGGVDVEQLRANYAGPSGITLIGNELANTIIGGLAADILNGGLGADVILGGAGADTLIGGSGAVNVLQGGAGDDVYILTAADTVVELAGEGVDTVQTNLISRTLGANLENLLYNGAGNFTGVGNALANVMTGAAGDDTLSGRGGNDSLEGGAGSDTANYASAAGAVAVDIALQTASADGDGGVDTFTSIENATGSAFGDALVGDSAVNTLTGGAGNDVLTGRGGSDFLLGGDGVDTATYAAAIGGVNVRLNGARALADGDGGVDTLSSIENVIGSLFADTLVGWTTNNDLTGGLGSDTLIGLEGNDTLRGGSGAANQLQGGLGDDVYILDANDTIVELAGQGIDTVQTSQAGRTLGANFENLTFTGTGNFAGIGNALANIIIGGAGADTLTGAGGNDTLNGGGGQDLAILSGLQASYQVVAAGGGFQITDNVAGRDGVDLLIGVERVRFSDGTTVLVSALAAAPAVVASAKVSDPPVLPAAPKTFAADPQVLPALDDDFVLKGDDLPLVLPAAALAEVQRFERSWDWNDRVGDVRFAALDDVAGPWSHDHDGGLIPDWFL